MAVIHDFAVDISDRLTIFGVRELTINLCKGMLGSRHIDVCLTAIGSAYHLGISAEAGLAFSDSVIQ